ncbi:DNA-binding protein [Pseudomonas sp. B14(2022)]|uniref:DNA-binding protein n=1 Tax=Pseudomonas sp. B14(2022) TaxID=2914043 RepID=UPI0014309D14|nr:DNA-binding protein [Pseudomonas sp. B14(2022)]NJJ56968.1 integrase [Pseudomonas sp. B14(2022)]
MARGGINKALVQKARQALLAKGMHPSIDGVRVELGNTGSKSTISRYLKELDAAERPVIELRDRIGNALRASVESLLDQVMEEGSEALTVAQAKFDEQIRDLEGRNQRLEGEFATLERQFEVQQSALEAQTTALQVSEMSLRDELGRNAQLNQARDDLERRIQERDEQIQSLEEKHVHARNALEHYREATKEQREQDQRRHENQLQLTQGELRQVRESLVVKQDELTRLSRDNERLIGEARQQAKALHAQSDKVERLTSQVQTLTLSDARAAAIIEHHETQVLELREEVKTLNVSAALAANREGDLTRRLLDLEAQLECQEAEPAETSAGELQQGYGAPKQDVSKPPAKPSRRRR